MVFIVPEVCSVMDTKVIYRLFHGSVIVMVQSPMASGSLPSLEWGQNEKGKTQKACGLRYRQFNS